MIMKLKDLFDKENIICPEWLSNKMIDSYWENADYSLEDNVHKWIFKDELRNTMITFDGETYIFGAYSPDGYFQVFEKETESEFIQV